MKRTVLIFILFCFSSIIMSGCLANHSRPLTKVVTQVDISCQQEDVNISRHYTDTQKMEYVLLYLRLLKRKGKPDADPDTLDKDIYEITVRFSDGSNRVYRQKAHKYFSEGVGAWQLIDPAQAAGLYKLMEKLPSDLPNQGL